MALTLTPTLTPALTSNTNLQGVYLPPDMYESMAREMSMHSVRISDVEARLRIEQRKAETKQSEVDAME
eukprot:1079963-Amorphochlora_amoeboformis.AAC.1